jgi:hypothetical protein
MAKANKTYRTTLARQAGARVPAFIDTHSKEEMRDQTLHSTPPFSTLFNSSANGGR